MGVCVYVCVCGGGSIFKIFSFLSLKIMKEREHADILCTNTLKT